MKNRTLEQLLTLPVALVVAVRIAFVFTFSIPAFDGLMLGVFATCLAKLFSAQLETLAMTALLIFSGFRFGLKGAGGMVLAYLLFQTLYFVALRVGNRLRRYSKPAQHVQDDETQVMTEAEKEREVQRLLQQDEPRS